MKKKILFIIAIIMIISTIIRTIIISASFYNFAEEFLSNETSLIKELYINSKNKNYFLETIKKSTHIYDIKKTSSIKNKIKFDFKNNLIYAPIKIENKENLLIIYNGREIFYQMYKAILQLLLIAIISLIIIILTVNYFLNPYLEILENVKKSTKEILKGNFNLKLKTKLKGEAKEFVESFNEFLEKIKQSLGTIEEQYHFLIETEKSSNPLEDAKKTITELANIFKFKKIIEDDKNFIIILSRLSEIMKHFEINNYSIIGVNNNTKEIVYNYSQGDICCSVLENIEECRAYYTKHIISSTDYKNICPLHTCESEYVCIPFSTNGNFTGIVKIQGKNIKEKIPYLKAYLNEISAIIEAKYTLALLHEQSIIDPLTGLYNRRYFDTIIKTLIANAKRNNSKVGFLMIDMDYFKKVNDTYGHDAGDEVLRQLANILKNSIRESDIIIRFGGEEFIIVLTNIKSLNNLKEVAEKIRTNVEKWKFNLPNSENIKKTVSIGGSLYPDQCDTPWKCVKFADLALYEAKENGRNQVVIFNEKLSKKYN